MTDFTEMQKLAAMICDVNNRLSDIHERMLLIKRKQMPSDDIDQLWDHIYELSGWVNDCGRTYWQIKDPELVSRVDSDRGPLIVTGGHSIGSTTFKF